jgi:hypothetical protein
MGSRAYTVLGWLVWQIAKREMTRNKAKLGAAATVALVLVAGLAAAKATSGDD